ncbi:40S ribosomal protein S15a [Camellia lanceoleosa]|uniref:40S ribosomal protein S15a n=1 Tax=Camellia lanceoleosa TaxID=1840588 RepID=A0ACC0F5C1_9ERIC|nr:40S ribosomal protein S15a [Camellia lanceoleosa]
MSKLTRAQKGIYVIQILTGSNPERTHFVTNPKSRNPSVFLALFSSSVLRVSPALAETLVLPFLLLEHFSFVRMVRVSVLNDALKSMYNAEKIGKRQVMIRPSSKVIIKFLIVMQKHGYIGEFEYVDDHRSGKIVVELNGRLNKCGVISPRFDVGVKEIEPWTARLLPSRQFGYIVLTTSAGSSQVGLRTIRSSLSPVIRET